MKPSIKGKGIDIFFPQQKENQQQTQQQEKITNPTTIPQTFRFEPETLKKFQDMYLELKKLYPRITKTDLVNYAIKKLLSEYEQGNFKL